MYNYEIKNTRRLVEEIDSLLSFQLQREQLKKALFERIVSDAKQNCEFLTPEQLFVKREYGVWFHTVNYPEFRGGIARYDTFVTYHCILADDRQTVEITLE